ncbi:gliding motility-associated ABC transporter permease subunit GldF [Marivirga sp. S37H4]|uniref:Gliding motility-associated ABC transporter permease subunit GldF n=1 Tax=Marivirga aurantiaca TaxID=2802615 RepID=A0A935C9J6_9BACT|nr:gliding motility-associated ABC transporter permease subunit GldF [Marivirga aurantiaca]MBK6266216.1 gliding motility-associated ABC transporter permease subunit GldF [Marivirga aurantiaca]
MWSIFKKEINTFLNSLIAYMVMAVFLISMGLLVWVFPDTSIFEYGYADLGIFFNLAPYVFMFLIPAITMRALAEESKTGTLELLLTKPINESGLLIGKYLAGVALVVVTLIPTLVYYFSLSYISNPAGNVDTAGIMGAYLGLILLASAYTSIGIFASALSDNQIVAFIIAVFISFIFFMGFSSLSDLEAMSGLDIQLEKLGMLAHYDALGKGVIDLRDVIYFVSMTIAFLGATFWILKMKKWNS